jgi:hypothetical protein
MTNNLFTRRQYLNITLSSHLSHLLTSFLDLDPVLLQTSAWDNQAALHMALLELPDEFESNSVKKQLAALNREFFTLGTSLLWKMCSTRSWTIPAFAIDAKRPEEFYKYPHRTFYAK